MKNKQSTLKRSMPYLKSLLLLMIYAVSTSCTLTQNYDGKKQKPNIVFIISDDQDYEHLGFMGNKTVKTPNLDRLAAEGSVFTHCHLTAARCRPSLASLLSGRFPHQNGIYANYHTKDLPKSNNDRVGEKFLSTVNSLPNLLKDAGYATYGTGKYWEVDLKEMGFTHGAPKANRNFNFIRKGGQEKLFNFIDEQAKNDKPMFIWWAPLLPHTPHNPPKEYLDLFDPESIPVPDYIHPHRRKEFLKKERLSLAMEYWTDLEVGKLRAKMKAVGEDKNTLYVFLIDNGWSNGLPSKGSSFEKGVRTPVIFTFPGIIPSGQKRDDLISSLDTYSTILSYAGIDIPKSAMGKDLRKNIQQKTEVGRDRLFGASFPTHASNSGKYPEKDVYALYVRTPKWKYVFYLHELKGYLSRFPWMIQHIATRPPERKVGQQNLYDLSQDPYELKDLSNDPQHKELMQELKKEVFEWWKETGGKAIPLPTDSHK